jgi:pentatricopeptide repeat protein
MQGQRGLEPNDIVFGCMLDALVCNNQVDEAVKLFVALTCFDADNYTAIINDIK